MKKLILGLGVSVFALSLTGCGSEVAVEEVKEKPLASRIGDSIDLSLAELLTKPRKQLAEMADEVAKQIQIQEKGRREGRLPFTLIPTLRLPLVVPVLREVHYSDKAGFSLPSYLAEDSKDSALALHLARHGDYEAAEKLVEPGDTETSQRIQEARFEREYPVEWTRLVALHLHIAQLRAVLDPQAARGTLGAALLSRGRQTLTRAAVAWREEKMVELAGQADATLADWGEVPALTTPFQPGLPRAAVTRLLRSVGDKRVLPALYTTRAFDLFALPFPDEGAEAVIASFDDADRLANLFVSYRAGLSEYFSEPAQLAFLLEERGLEGKDGPKETGLRSRVYGLGEVECAVSVVAHGAGVGAFVRFGSATDAKTTAKIERDFGGANLDRTFEQNRVLLAPEQLGKTELTIGAKALSQLRNPFGDLQLAQAELRRENGQNLASALLLRSTLEAGGQRPFHKLALPFWGAFGLGQIQGISDKSGGHIALTWEDTRTRYTLCLPYDTQPVELEISDRQAPEKLAEREKAALALDRLEREERLKAGKPLVRIARYLEQIELGMKRNEVLKFLPPGQGVVKHNMPGGLAITFRGEPARTDGFVVRQMFIRFDNDRVVELRARYIDGPAAGKDTRWMRDLLTAIRKRAGAQAELAPPWAKLWADLPAQKPAPLSYRWQDDITALVYQLDAGGVEIAVRDCSADPVVGLPLSPLEYLPRGPANVQLGDERQQLLQRWGVSQPVIAGDGALVLRPAQGSPFDAFLIYFGNDHAMRIVARHVPNANRANPSQAVIEAWGRELPTLGWPRRQDQVVNDILQSFGWHDDRTRIRIFWQETETGPPRIFTEWKELQ